MSKTILFYAPGFCVSNARLQPWRYVYELAKKISTSNRVVIITDAVNDNDWSGGELFQVVELQLSAFSQRKIFDVIAKYSPAQIWWSATKRSIVFYPLYRRCKARLKIEIIFYITSPFYNFKDLARAFRAGVPYTELRTLLTQSLVPWVFFRRLANSSIVSAIFVQSEKNMGCLLAEGFDAKKSHLLRVGVDQEDFSTVSKAVLASVSHLYNKRNEEFTYLYMGAIRNIRGFHLLKESFCKAARRSPQLRLMVLARAADEALCDELVNEFRNEGMLDNVTVIGGWLTKEEVRAHIDCADAVTLPFALVPSDVPVAALEALARGKPIIVSPVDGLPELANGRGVIVEPAQTEKFAADLAKFAEDKDRWESAAREAKQYMDQYPTWSEVGVSAVKLAGLE